MATPEPATDIVIDAENEQTAKAAYNAAVVRGMEQMPGAVAPTWDEAPIEVRNLWRWAVANPQDLQV